MKTKRKIFAVIMSLLLAVSPFYNLQVIASPNTETVAESTVTDEETDNALNKIHFYFGNEDHNTIDDVNELNKATENIMENAVSGSVNGRSAIGNPSTTENEEIWLTIQFESDFMETDVYKAFCEERDTLESIEEVRDFRSRLNAYSKSYHTELINNNIDTLPDIEYNDIDIIGYSPFVTLKVDVENIASDDLLAIAESENIKHASLSYEPEAESEMSWNETMETINAYDIVSSSDYTGDGVRIGILESGGVCDISHLNLCNADIMLRYSPPTIKNHATIVTSIIVAMAPDAEYFVSPVVSRQEGISWFIDQGCDIVNCSFGYYSNNESDGVYTEGERAYRYDIDSIYDYQIEAHFVTVVKSAGNKNTDNTSSSYNPNSKIVSPGYAHNVITVGGVTEDSSGRLIHAPNSCYKSVIPKTKPNISAPYYVKVDLFDETGGTSLSAPLVTGSIALLLESDVSYIASPHRIMSVITSTAKKTYDYTSDVGQFDDRIGAGVIDLERMISCNLHSEYVNTYQPAGKTIITKSVYLAAGTEIQVGLAWMISTGYNPVAPNNSVKQIYVTDYDLRIFNPSGSRVAYSSLSLNNVEMIRYTVPSSGTYKITVYQTGAMNANNTADCISLTYNY